MNIRTRLAAAAFAGLAIAAAGATTASAVSPTAGLPAASGRPVGVTTLNLTDRSRQDPWTHAGPRRIVVSAFYPARRAVRSPARYVSPALADALAQAYQVPPAPWRAVRTHAGAGVAARPGRHPIVLVSPGAVMPRSSVTLVAEDLAAHGYVALVLDHPGDAAAVDLAGGEIRPVDAGFLAGVLSGQPDIDKAVRIRIADVRFVLDRLPAIGRRGVLRDRLDRKRIAMVGHSIGGSPAANVMLADRRVDVGVNYDGDYFLAAAKRAPRRPFMTMTGGASDNQRAFFAAPAFPRPARHARRSSARDLHRPVVSVQPLRPGLPGGDRHHPARRSARRATRLHPGVPRSPPPGPPGESAPHTPHIPPPPSRHRAVRCAESKGNVGLSAGDTRATQTDTSASAVKIAS